MSLEKLFYHNLRWWNEHCEKVQFSSNILDYLDCDGYRNLVSMGKTMKNETLQLIRDNCEDIPDHGLVCLVAGIIGENFQIPKEIRGKVQEIADYTIEWLDENLSKYI